MKKLILIFLIFPLFLFSQDWNQVGDHIVGELQSFGQSIATSDDGTVFAVGSPKFDPEGNEYSEAGAIKVFHRVNDVWVQKGQTIVGETATGTGLTDNGYYGENLGNQKEQLSLNSDGTILAVGSPSNTNDNEQITGGTNQHVKVYQFIDGSWVQMGQNITTSAEHFTEAWFFGKSVSLSDDGLIIAIGAPGGGGQCLNATTPVDHYGNVNIFQFNGSSWTQMGQTITGWNTINIGESLDISGDGETIIIGSAGGSAAAFKFINNSWVQLGSIFETGGNDSWWAFGSSNACQNANELDGYGYWNWRWDNVSISNDGTTVALANKNQILVKTFRFSNESNNWYQLGQTLTGNGISSYEGYNNQQANDMFGTDISLSGNGNTIAVSNSPKFYYNHTAEQNDGDEFGVIKIYNLDNDAWLESSEIISTDNYEYWGQSVELSTSGTTLIASAPHNYFAEITDYGVVRVFTTNTSCSITAPLDITIVGCGNISNFGEATSDCSDSSVFNDAPSSFNLGENIITWTVTSESGDVSSATQTVTVIDDVNPTITAPTSVDVSTNNECTAINVSLGSATTSDNCSVGSITSDAPTSFDIGETTVTWTVTDESGNSSTDTQTVVVTDNSNPTVICNELSLTLENGVASISAVDLDNGSYDECGEITLEINQTDFDESHIGDNIVVLTVTDEYGNSSSCESTVTVEAGMGIEDNILANIYLYPNPTSDLVFIAGVDSELNAVVYDLLGKQVMRKYITKKIDISILEKGVYFVRLSNGINNSVHKIIKN